MKANKEIMSMRAAAFALAVAALGLGGCAFENPRNTPLLTLLDARVKPQTTTAKVALGVVFVPVGVVAGALDLAVVHPLQSVVLGAEDTRLVLWGGQGGSTLEQALSFVPKAVITPFVFTFCWLGESAFDMRRPDEGGRQ